MAEVGIFLAENPEFLNRIQGYCTSARTLYNPLDAGISEKRRADAKPKTTPRTTTSASGGAALPPPEGEDGRDQIRKTDTPQGQNDFWDQLKKSGEWEPAGKFSRPTLRNQNAGDSIQKSREKWEIEVFGRRGQHKGIIRPSEGIVRAEFVTPGRKIS